LITLKALAAFAGLRSRRNVREWLYEIDDHADPLWTCAAAA
jgi:hypothetical protein